MKSVATTLSSTSATSILLSMCTPQTEHLLTSNGKESSVTLDLFPPQRQQMNPCKRTFRAPESYRFIVKLVKFKSKQMRNPNSHVDSKTGGVSVDIYNETATCPLNIVSIIDIFFFFNSSIQYYCTASEFICCVYYLISMNLSIPLFAVCYFILRLLL